MIGKISFNGGLIRTPVGPIPIKFILLCPKDNPESLTAETMNTVSPGDVLEITENNSRGPKRYDAWVYKTTQGSNTGLISYWTCNPKLTDGTLEYNSGTGIIKPVGSDEAEITSVNGIASLEFVV